MDDNFLDLAQRVAALEAKAEQGAQERKEMKGLLEQIQVSQQTALAKIGLVHDKQTKWEGRFGGVLFVVGCLWAFFTDTAKAIWHWLELIANRGG